MFKNRVQFGVVGCLLSVLVLSCSSFSVLADPSNHPPNPPIIEGEKNGMISEYYNYSFLITDPDENIMLNLEIEWGDGLESVDCGCIQAWRNGTVVIVPHSYETQGDYGITARVQDEYGIWSNWSEPYVVSMPKTIGKFRYTSWLFNEVFPLSFFLEKIIFGRFSER